MYGILVVQWVLSGRGEGSRLDTTHDEGRKMFNLTPSAQDAAGDLLILLAVVTVVLFGLLPAAVIMAVL